MTHAGWLMPSTLKAKVLVLVLLAAFASVVPAVLALGIAGQLKRSIDAIYRDRVSLESLLRVEEFVREVELRIPGVMTDMFSGPGSKSYIESALPGVERAWTDYRARLQGDKSAGVVRDFDEAFQRFKQLLARLGPALAAQDRKQLEALSGEWLDLKRKLLKPLSELVTTTREDVAQEVRHADGLLRRTAWTIGIGLGAFLLTMLPVSFALWRGITVPIRRTVRLVKDLAEGDGDLQVRLDASRRDEMGELSRWFNSFMDKLHGIIGKARSTALQVASASQQLSTASEQLSAGSHEQASSLEETAASLEEITGTVRQNADSAREANQLAAGCRETAEKGRAVVASAVASMEEITRASKRIAAIITVIDEIAFQTNLLALNAAVEAARAGDQGRGFAVVAAEVRNLAQRSAAAAREIKALIQDSVAKVGEGAILVGRSGQSLEEIVTAVTHVGVIIGDIAQASQEQSQGIDQVNRAVAQMDHVVQQNASQTSELASTAQALTQQAVELEALVGRFRLDGAGPEPVAPARRPVRPERTEVGVAARRGVTGRVGLAARPSARTKAAAGEFELSDETVGTPLRAASGEQEW